MERARDVMRRVVGLLILVFLLLMVGVPGASPQGEPPKQEPPATDQGRAAKAANSSIEKPARLQEEIQDSKLKIQERPERVSIPGATTLHVVLDTPLSTRIAKKGQRVEFLTTEAVWLADGLELPKETRITGTVTEAKRPGLFGRRGALRLRLERIELDEGGAAEIVARLEGVDVRGGRISSDTSRSADLYSMAMWSLTGTLIGSQVKGGKGAAIGAGAGAAAGLILLMARRGPDVYLEPGMPFSVILDDAVELRTADIPAAGRKTKEADPPPTPEATTSAQLSQPAAWSAHPW